MIIAIDLTSLSYHMSGIERYAFGMTEKIIKLDLKNEYVLIFRNSVPSIFNNNIDGKRVKARILRGNNKLLFLQVVLPFNLYKLKADKYIFFAFTSPILFRNKYIYNTIHDMGAWDASDTMSFTQKLYWQITYRFAAKISNRIFTVSDFSKNRINEILKFPKNRIEVIYSGVYDGLVKEENIDFAYVKKIYNLPDKYILTLSTIEPRKNIELLLKAYTNIQDKVNYNLVLVGRKGWKVDELINRYNSKSRIIMTGFVKDEHISLIYKHAICFVFPSLYEGFGLPPIEALAHSTPVIASDAASLPEILMDRATYFKSNDIKNLEEVLIKLENNIKVMPKTLNKFQKRNYNFEASARKILKMIGD